MKRITPEIHIAILTQLLGGLEPHVIAGRLGLDLEDFTREAEELGYPDTDVMVDRLEQLRAKRRAAAATQERTAPRAPVPAPPSPTMISTPPQAVSEPPAPAPDPEPVPTPAPAPAPAPEPTPAKAAPTPAIPRPASADLRRKLDVDLERARKLDLKAITTQADRVAVALTRLCDLLDEHEVDAERLARIAALEQQIREAEAKIRALQRTRVSSPVVPEAAASAREIRTWAAEQGIACPGSGRIPAHVMTRYVAAHQQAAS